MVTDVTISITVDVVAIVILVAALLLRHKKK
jgi:hypothetical protein